MQSSGAFRALIPLLRRECRHPLVEAAQCSMGAIRTLREQQSQLTAQNAIPADRFSVSFLKSPNPCFYTNPPFFSGGIQVKFGEKSVSYHSTEKRKHEDAYQYVKVTSARKLFLTRTGVQQMNSLAFLFGLANTLYIAMTILVMLLFITWFVLHLFFESSALYWNSISLPQLKEKLPTKKCWFTNQ